MNYVNNGRQTRRQADFGSMSAFIDDNLLRVSIGLMGEIIKTDRLSAR